MTPNPTITVDSAGNGYVGTSPFYHEAVSKLRARAGAAGAANIGPPPQPAAPLVNDTTMQPPSIVNRVRDAMNPGRVARMDAVNARVGAAPSAAPVAGTAPTPVPSAAPAAGVPPVAPPPPPVAPVAPAAGGGTPSIVSRARGVVSGSGGGIAGKVLGRALPIAGVIAANEAYGDAKAPDSTDRYAQRFNVDPPTGDGSIGDVAKFAALRAGGFASDLGNHLTGGIAGNFYRDQPNAPRPGGSVEPVTAPSATSAAASSPAPGPAAATESSADRRARLSKLVDDKTYVPEAGTGLIRNEGTGDVMEVGGAPAAGGATGTANGATGAAMPTMPDASLALDSRTLPQFLKDYSGAANSIVARNIKQGDANAEAGRAKVGAETRKTTSEANQNERLDGVMQELMSLDDNSDPGGARRAELKNTILTLGGHADARAATDTPRDRYLRTLTATAFPGGPGGDPGKDKETQAWIDDQMKQYDAQRGGGADGGGGAKGAQVIPTASNPKTGEKMRWNGTAWVSA